MQLDNGGGKLTDDEVLGLERATMLGTLSTNSLPAMDSSYGITSDRRLGWRFMEDLCDSEGTPPPTMDRDPPWQTLESVQQRCHCAVKYGLRVLAALKPLHERGLVHAALAPKQIARIVGDGDGTEEYKLLGLGSLHLSGEASRVSASKPLVYR